MRLQTSILQVRRSHFSRCLPSLRRAGTRAQWEEPVSSFFPQLRHTHAHTKLLGQLTHSETHTHTQSYFLRAERIRKTDLQRGRETNQQPECMHTCFYPHQGCTLPVIQYVFKLRHPCSLQFMLYTLLRVHVLTFDLSSIFANNAPLIWGYSIKPLCHYLMKHLTGKVVLSGAWICISVFNSPRSAFPPSL